MRRYPTWIMLTTKLVVTEEGQNGKPDATIVKDGRRWHLKVRGRPGPWSRLSYARLAEAKAAYDLAFEPISGRSSSESGALDRFDASTDYAFSASSRPSRISVAMARLNSIASRQ